MISPKFRWFHAQEPDKNDAIPGPSQFWLRSTPAPAAPTPSFDPFGGLGGNSGNQGIGSGGTLRFRDEVELQPESGSGNIESLSTVFFLVGVCYWMKLSDTLAGLIPSGTSYGWKKGWSLSVGSVLQEFWGLSPLKPIQAAHSVVVCLPSFAERWSWRWHGNAWNGRQEQ